MAEKYDVIVVGAGHNGLIVASYLAKAGVKVCVVEHQEEIGGGTMTKELTLPGFKHDICSVAHYIIFANPLFKNDELGLMSKHGLKYTRTDKLTGIIFEDDSFIQIQLDIDKTCESIAKISPQDADTYKKFEAMTGKMVDLIAMGMFGPSSSAGVTHAMMDQSPEGRSLLRAMSVSAWDLVDEWFVHDKIKTSLSRYGAEAMINPFDKGTGMGFYIILPFMHRYGGHFPVGGSGELAKALGRCLESHGGTIKVSSTVKQFKIAGGETTGVILESGEEILASKAVVANLNVKQVFPNMVPGFELPENFSRDVKNIHHSRYSPFVLHMAIKEKPKFKIGQGMEDYAFVEWGHSNFEEYYMALHKMDLGYPITEFSNACLPTSFDPTRAPAGKHIIHDYALVPYDLKDGGAARWDEIGQEMADAYLRDARKHIVNIGDENVLGSTFMTPLDIARHNPAMLHSDICHIGTYNWQTGGNRPLPGWHQYRMPVNKLYMCGSSTHPGGGVIGGGRAAVQIIMEDLGIDFEKIISK